MVTTFLGGTSLLMFAGMELNARKAPCAAAFPSFAMCRRSERMADVNILGSLKKKERSSHYSTPRRTAGVHFLASYTTYGYTAW